MDPRVVRLSRPTGTASPVVLCHGLIATDFLVRAAWPVPRDVKVRADGISRQGGGPAANAAVAIARLGGRAVFAGAVGDDALGREQIAELEAEGVDTSGVEIVPGIESFVSLVLIDESDGARTIYSAPATRPLRAAAAEPLPGPNPGLLLVDGWGGDSQRAAVDEARSRGIPVLLDAGSPREVVIGLLDRVDVVIASTPFSEGLTGPGRERDTVRDLLARGARLAAVTRGERGVIAGAGGAGELFEVPVVPVEVVDTTGAGDAFHGAAAWALAAGRAWEPALALAAAVAAWKCRRTGARAGLPTLAELPSRPRLDTPGTAP